MTRVPAADFEERYRVEVDPWQFSTSEYEQRRYDLTLAALPRARYRFCAEPGCAIGELTHRLAARCDRVLAIDVSPTVVEAARDRLRQLPNVTVEVGDVSNWPPGPFDLVVLSEVGYYFDVEELAGIRDHIVASLETGGHLIAVHWRGRSEDHLLHGDEVHDVLRTAKGIDHLAMYIDRGFRLEIWERT